MAKVIPDWEEMEASNKWDDYSSMANHFAKEIAIQFSTFLGRECTYVN